MLNGYPSDDIAFVRGSENLFTDFGAVEPGKRLLRAALASEIIRRLDIEQLSARNAALLTGTGVGDLSRIRHVKLKRFTIDQLMTILYRLNLEVNVSISISPRRSRLARASSLALDPSRPVAIPMP
jgi:predicted XRE-type DNA-binding protein